MLLAVIGFGVLWAHPQQSIPTELQTAIEDAIAERDMDFARRMEVVKQIDSIFSNSKPIEKYSNETWLKARFVEAVANMRLNQLDLSATQIEELRNHIDPKRFPGLWFRYRSFTAALNLLRGHRKESLKAFEELLSEDTQEVPSFVVDQARINYAAALYEDGRSKESVEMYETVMLDALEHQNDRAALHAGNNLLSMFIRHGDAEAARNALTELEPVMTRNAKAMATQAIRIRSMDLLLLEGKTSSAVTALRAFLDQTDAPAPLLLGNVHRLLANALGKEGELEQAQFHAEKCVELLGGLANEATVANATLAKVLLLKHDYDAALRVLDRVDLDSVAVAERKALVQHLRLEANLRRDGRDEEAEMLTSMVIANEAKGQLHSKSVSDYFDSKLAAVRRNLAAQQTESEARIKIETDRLVRSSRYLVYTLLTAAGLGGVLLLYVDLRRRGERKRLAEQKMQNEKLEAIVQSKTLELTANLKAQSEMAQALERKKRVETIGLLAGNVAHDINNLLQVIANANQTLASSVIDEGQRAEVLNVSNDSLRHGSGIIRQLLAYSRQQELSAQAVRVQDYLNECRGLLRSALGDRIELTIEDNSQDAFIYIDPSQLTTAILNILSNASEAMPNGGNVSITTDRYHLTERNVSEWSNLNPGVFVQFSIVDTGCGMNEEQLSRAFEPFFSTKTKGKGMGLGLSSVYGFVKQSGGDIRLLSTPSFGTQVQILLPLVSPPQPKLQPPAVDSFNILVGKRLLLVEDHKAVATSLMTLLSHLKLQSKWVASGDEAMELLRTQSDFDFVLSDVHMPGAVDGIALARWIKTELPEIKVMLMSGYHDIPFEQFDVPVLPKPFNIRELAAFLTQNA